MTQTLTRTKSKPVRKRRAYVPTGEVGKALAAAADLLALRQAQKWEQSQGIAQDNPTVYVAITFAKP